MDSYNYFQAGSHAGKVYCEGAVKLEEVERTVATLPEYRSASWFNEEMDARGNFWRGFWSSAEIYCKKEKPKASTPN